MVNWSSLLKYDLKSFLKNAIELKQKKNPRFSQRAMAKYLKMSPSTLNEIIKGKRTLTKKTIEKIKKAFAEDPEFQETIKAHEQNALNFFHAENPELTNLSTAWFHEAILELVQTPDFSSEPQWIAQRLGLTPEVAQHAFEKLVQVGEVKIESSGKAVVATRHSLITGEAHREELRQKARSCLSKMESSIKDQPYEERFFGCMTIAMSPEDFELIRTKMTEFIKEHALYLSRAGIEKKEVYMISLGCFPLSKAVRKKS